MVTVDTAEVTLPVATFKIPLEVFFTPEDRLGGLVEGRGGGCWLLLPPAPLEDSSLKLEELQLVGQPLDLTHILTLHAIKRKK